MEKALGGYIIILLQIGIFYLSQNVSALKGEPMFPLY